MSGQTTFGGETFGDAVVHPNALATLVGTVKINDEAAAVGDVVAIYVGEELRGKYVISNVYQGVAYVSGTISCKGGDETATFKVYDASAKAVFQVPGITATILPGGAVGSHSSPFLIEAVGNLPVDSGQNSRPIQKGALQPLTLAEMSNNPFGFSYETEKGKTYKVECSTDLIRWYEVDLVKGTGNEVKFTDKRQRLFEQQFYRVVLE